MIRDVRRYTLGGTPGILFIDLNPEVEVRARYVQEGAEDGRASLECLPVLAFDEVVDGEVDEFL